MERCRPGHVSAGREGQRILDMYSLYRSRLYQQGEKDREYQTCILSTIRNCISRERRIDNIKHVFSLQYEIVSAGKQGQTCIVRQVFLSTICREACIVNKDRHVSLDMYFSLQFIFNSMHCILNIFTTDKTDIWMLLIQLAVKGKCWLVKLQLF